MMTEKPTLVDKIYQLETELPSEIFLRQPTGDTWHELTYAEAIREARQLISAMKKMGLVKGDKVGIYSKNCYQWIITEMAVMMGGFVTVPFYANLVGESLKEVIDLSGIKLLFVGKIEDWSGAKTAIPKDLPLVRFPHYEGNARIDQGTPWQDFIAEVEPDRENHRPGLQDVWAIFYTSGTTGTPKGVVHTYGAPANLMIDQQEKYNSFNLADPGKNIFLSYLPLNHIAEQALVIAGGLYQAGQISFVESLESFAKNLADVQPSVFLAVPRIWTKFQQGVLAKMPQKKLDRLLSIPLVSSLVKKKIRKALGLSRTKLVISGASALPKATIRWYEKLGIYIRETYGMTETVGVVIIQPTDDRRIEATGRRLEECQIKIDPETDEILVKNSWLFKEYYEDAELTQASFDSEGFYKTGDTGSLDQDGYLQVKGRVKDTFKTLKGEFIVPTPIEDRFAANTLIEQICLVGLGLPQPLALIRLSEHAANLANDEIEGQLLRTLREANQKLHRHERIDKLVCISEEWSIENGLLTPTMKIKRNRIHQRYQEQYEHWCDHSETIIHA